jgi:hypothetical protein
MPILRGLRCCRLLRRFGARERHTAASSSLGWCPETGAGRRIGSRDAACHGRLPTTSATRSRRRSNTYCLVAWSPVTWWNKLEWMTGAGSEIVHWWTSLRCPSAVRRDLWTSIILAFSCIWRHRIDVVFNGATPVVAAIRHRIREEFQRWRVARLFRSDSLGFSEPFPFSWRDGD